MLTLRTQQVGRSKTRSVILYIYVILLSAVTYNVIPHPHNTTHKHNKAHIGMTAPKSHILTTQNTNTAKPRRAWV